MEEDGYFRRWLERAGKKSLGKRMCGRLGSIMGSRRGREGERERGREGERERERERDNGHPSVV